MKKNLDCEFKRGGWDGYSISEIPIADLWASVPIAEVHRGVVFFDAVKDDIAKNGLHFPILVVDATRRELEEQKKRFKDRMKPLPFWTGDKPEERIKVVWGGSNRLEVARALGFTSIDCVIMPSFDAARKKQASHRKPYSNKFYGGRGK